MTGGENIKQAKDRWPRVNSTGEGRGNIAPEKNSRMSRGKLAMTAARLTVREKQAVIKPAATAERAAIRLMKMARMNEPSEWKPRIRATPKLSKTETKLTPV